MNPSILQIIVSTICFTTALNAAWTDTSLSSGSINDGDTFIKVSINTGSSDTPIEMTGGCIGSLFIYGQSRIIISGGRISSEYYSFHPENNDGDNVYYCPPIHTVNLYDQSHLVMSGGEITDDISISSNASMEVLGYGFSYVADMRYPYHKLTGFWADDTPFTLRFVENSYERVSLNVIPEPATFILLGLGGLLSRYKHNG